MKYQSTITSLAVVALAASSALETVSSFVPTASTGAAPQSCCTIDQHNTQQQWTKLSVASSEIVDEVASEIADEGDVKPRKTRKVRHVTFLFLLGYTMPFILCPSLYRIGCTVRRDETR